MVRLGHCRLACSHFIKRWLHIFIFKHCEVALCCYIRETATARTDVEWKWTSAGRRCCSHAAPCVLGMDLAVRGGLLQRQQCVLAKLQSGEAGMSIRIASCQSENQPNAHLIHAHLRKALVCLLEVRSRSLRASAHSNRLVFVKVPGGAGLVKVRPILRGARTRSRLGNQSWEKDATVSCIGQEVGRTESHDAISNPTP
jgi:hypothetical protein